MRIWGWSVQFSAVREHVELGFRSEVFNLANTPHHSAPNGNVTSGDFMVATGIAGTEEKA